MSLPEVLPWKAIRGGGIERLKFRRQRAVGPYVLDFYCEAAKLSVEVDGADHGARAARSASQAGPLQIASPTLCGRPPKGPSRRPERS